MRIALLCEEGMESKYVKIASKMIRYKCYTMVIKIRFFYYHLLFEFIVKENDDLFLYMKHKNQA
jgi:hypothetical protein